MQHNPIYNAENKLLSQGCGWWETARRLLQRIQLGGTP